MVVLFGLDENPYAYFDEAILRQGGNINIGDEYPSGFKQVWEAEGYKYTVRSHPANPDYGKSGSIFRVSRQEVGKGTNYLDKNRNWYHESTLKPGKNGNINPNFNEEAEDTHIEIDNDKKIGHAKASYK